MTTTRPTPEAIAADIYATAQAHKAGVITEPERKWRLDVAWLTASRLALTNATVRALATLEANTRPFGPGTLDVLIAAETADPGAVCDAVEALVGEDCGCVAVTADAHFVLTPATLAALVRALRGGSDGT